MSNKETDEKELKLPWSNKQPWWLRLLIHIGLIVLAGLLLLWGSMFFLKIYTRHGKAIETPDIIGLSQVEASEMLGRSHLNMEVVDSVYVEGQTPGIILDTTPKAGSRIKPYRTIFVTVNTMNVKSIKIPEFEELSERSVEMMLKGAGFKNVTIEYVPGPHHLLVLHLKDSTGRYLSAGERIPYNTHLIMEVSSAEAYETAMMDSLENSSLDLPLDTPIEEPSGENWF